MANGASRIFKVMQNSGTDTVSELVHLKVKTINPLTFTLDDRVTLTEDFVELNSNINKSNLKIDDVLTAFSLNGGQLFFIQQYFSENPISRELPAGGNQGQILSKKSNEDYDAQWIDNNGGITVVDNLNSDSTTDALSAKQGKELNEKISGIIESGSNSNGSYIKFSDGTMICRKYINFGEMEVSNTWGSMYETSELSIGNYAQPFIEIPQISVMPLNTFFVEKRGNTTATSWGSFWATRPVSTTIYIGVDCIAIGKWK